MAGGEGLAVISKPELSSYRLSAVIMAIIITIILITQKLAHAGSSVCQVHGLRLFTSGHSSLRARGGREWTSVSILACIRKATA